MKIAILYICTGEYYKFWDGFYKSSQEYFCTEQEKKYFVFTDNNCILSSDNIEVIYQDNLGWPLNTLYRYRMFLRIREQLASFEYVVFFNSNCEFVKQISLIDFFGEKQIIACQHPGFFNKSLEEFTYESRSASSAYVYNKNFYFAGGIHGGEVNIFLDICKNILNSIDIDFNNGYMAIWHDESHWNAFLNNNYQLLKDKLQILSPAYLYPEDWDIPFEKRIILRNKSKIINVDKIKGNECSNKLLIFSYFKKLLR